MSRAWQPVLCEAGHPERPGAILWAGERLRVIEYGRRWEADDGLHMLVRVMDDRTLELRRHGDDWSARIVSAPPQHV